jgi:hypothetical protein
METFVSVLYYGSIFLGTVSLMDCIYSCSTDTQEEHSAPRESAPTQSAPRRSARIALKKALAKMYKEEAQRRARVKAELRAMLKRDPDPDSDWNHCVECGEPEHGENAMCDPAVRGGW